VHDGADVEVDKLLAKVRVPVVLDLIIRPIWRSRKRSPW
jgi:hypothetical protein